MNPCELALSDGSRTLAAVYGKPVAASLSGDTVNQVFKDPTNP